MKNIELTEEHKSKLLEMCKMLFPEYKSIVFSKDHEQFEESEDNNILLFFSGKAEIAPSIHWFEFCMRDLQSRILGISDYKTTQKFLMRTIFQCEQPHPIDYLYEEFKKLK